MNLATLMAGIDRVTPDGGDWCSAEKATNLAALIAATRPALVVEVGVWMGGSAIPMAMALQEVGRGRLVAVDPWEPQASAAGQNPTNAAWWTGVDHEAAFRRFCDRIRVHGLESVVEVARMRSDDYVAPGAIGLLHVDGNHGEQATRDVERLAPWVEPGGFCVLDDINWEGGAVGQAASTLTDRLGFRRLYDLGTGAVFQKVA